ncbi:hypothetical protein BKH43_05890 [Helicobacter sp. 13S00401-1]|uniref:HAD-IB family hydrolase n=1 Tax=Helicobacter sp. 13S00401-1 TaxID=1905758 RepID=UPI000BA7BED7|nr:HAD-IB family hydrolase [Helicobacter sp. 13S00401-1]PAF50139.1 hypothetical protein BKH43_05890 [Helicobacter sp. 13S00401-1]
MAKKGKEIAFFDFDGTITRSDSFARFMKFVLGKSGFYKAVFSNLHLLLLFKLKLLTNEQVKKEVVKKAFSNFSLEVFNQKCKDFLPLLLSDCKASGLDRIKKHINEGVEVVLVSASFEDYLQEFTKSMGIGLIGTKLEKDSLKLSGNFASKNCYGPEKVKRIKELFNLEEYEKIYVYGDTRGDKEMLMLASKDCGFYRYFH